MQDVTFIFTIQYNLYIFNKLVFYEELLFRVISFNDSLDEMGIVKRVTFDRIRFIKIQ